MTPLSNIPTVIVSGARGAGKTTLLAELVGARPAQERRAVLLTESGATSLPPRENVTVVAAEPGCICCVGQVGLRVALTRLLRDSRPERLYVELTEPAHLAASLRTLQSPWLAPVLRIEDVIGVVDGGQADGAPLPAAWLEHLTELRVRSDPGGRLAGRVAAARPSLRVSAAC